MAEATCAELVELVKTQGAKALKKVPGLDEYLDINRAAEFTGLSQAAVRHYHGLSRRAHAAGIAGAKWYWPEPDLVVARHPAWTKRTLVLSRASMPGRGAGGGRPWPKKPASASSSS